MISPAWAQGMPGGPPSPLVNLLPLAAVFVIFYFLLIRPQQQKAKEHRTMLANLKRNDMVVTAGGIFGRVMSLSEKIVTLEIAPNVRVQVERPQITALANETKGGGEDSRDSKDSNDSKNSKDSKDVKDAKDKEKDKTK